ncbi:hypothetical protein CHU98_g1102 [Xylaria longipes]|nr:hypothetical protein CHU98_g1102 [Xylaria longipes]
MATASLAIQGAPKKKPEGLDLYWRFALAGALGCSAQPSPAISPGEPSNSAVRVFQKQAIDLIGLEKHYNRTTVYSVSAVSAEFFAFIALCPLEATCIRFVSSLSYAKDLISRKIFTIEGISTFYASFGPIFFK